MVFASGPGYATQTRMLKTQIDSLFEEAESLEVEGDIMGLIVPDANLLRGGRVAANIFSVLKGRSFDTVLVISSSHVGRFGRISICSVDDYRTPLGELAVNDHVRNELCDEDDDLFVDDQGHYQSSGIDVQLPFLQRALETFDIVPIIMGEETPAFCRELGVAVGEVMYGRNALIVASASILSSGTRRLKQFKKYFESGDVSRVMGILNSERVRMVGRGALIASMIAALHRRANSLRVLHLEPASSEYPGAIGAVMTRN